MRFRKAVLSLVAIGALAGATGASAVVGPPPEPVNATPPTISGTAQVGQTLQGHEGVWGASTLVSGHDWWRCDPSGHNCLVEGGCFNCLTYAVVDADVGHTVRLRETAQFTFPGLEGIAFSAPTSVVTKASTKTRHARLTIQKQPQTVIRNSRFVIKGFVGGRPDPKGGKVVLTPTRGKGNLRTVSVPLDKFGGFNARVNAGNGNVVRYHLSYVNPGWQTDAANTRLIKVVR
jgi:hypothetical protein